MAKSIKKRGQKILRRFSRLSKQVEEDSREHIKENFIDRISHIQNIKILILEWFLLVSALIMFAITQAIWFDHSYSNNTFVGGGTYIEGTVGKVTSLNPLFATTDSEKALSRLLFATLTNIDYSGHSGLGLAESVISSESGKTWTIKLRDNLFWSDGEPLTNEDVLFTILLIQNPSITTIYDSNLLGVTIRELEDGRISFILPSEYADFSSALNIPVLPKHVLENADPKTLIENSFSKKPITSGAFTFNAAQILSNDERIIYLTTNDYYYKGKPFLNNFAIHTFADEEELIAAINSGKISATADISTANADKVNPAIYSKKSLINSGVYAFINSAKSPFNDVNIRKAIKQGINLANIRSVAPSEKALDYPLVESQITLSDYPAVICEDFEAAKATLEPIMGENPAKAKIVTVNTNYLPAIANAFADNLRNLGFEVEVSIYNESQDFINTILAKRDYNILIYEIELGADPDIMAYYHSSQATSSGLNLSSYSNPYVDELLLGARENTSLALRTSKYEFFLKYWASEVPAIGIYQSSITYFYNKNVRAYSDDNRLVTALDRFYDIETWAVQKQSRNRTP